jgi:hypothetical protein
MSKASSRASRSRRSNAQLFGAEALEGRRLFASVFNALVNNPAADLTSRDTQSETTTIAFGNTVVVAYNDSGSNAVSATKFTGYARSTDGGLTFTDLGQLPTVTGGDSGDPVLARDETTGRIYLSTLRNSGVGIQVFRSDDNGLTFGSVTTAFTSFSSVDFADKEWITVDNFAGTGRGNVYLATRNFPGTGSATPAGVFFSRSTNSGDTWGAPIQISSAGQGANVVVGTDHSVYVFWYEASTIRMRKSVDLGVTFDSTVVIANLTGAGSNGSLGLEFRSNSFAQVVVNPVSGALYVVYNDDPAGADRGNIFFRQSTNGGASWSAAVTLNDDGGTTDQFFPTLAVSPNGRRVFVGWYDRRTTANTHIANMGTIATVNTATNAVNFGANFLVSDDIYPAVFGVDPAINATYMGDYDTVSATATHFHYSFADNRLASAARAGNQADVRHVRIPIDGPAGPVVLGTVLGYTTTAPTTVELLFNQPMNTSSFDLVADLESIVAPGGVDIRSLVSGFSWQTDRVLRLSFSQALAVKGSYTVNLASSVLSASGVPLDQNLANGAGEVGDSFNGRFIVDVSSAADGFGYVATSTVLEAIDLVEGAPGVLKPVDNVDDGTGSISLGANSFSFYGTSFSTVFVSSNGLITFGSANSEFTNSDLTSVPSQAAIAVLWDDWITNAGTTPTNSAVLAFIDTANNRLIVEWNAVLPLTGTDPVTFQAILQLNTGAVAGNMVLQYPDITSSGSTQSNAASATVGIKAAGTQGPNRLLISQNSANNPLVGTGKAILVAIGTTTGTVSGTVYADNDASNTLAGENGLTGVTVFADVNGDALLTPGEPSAVSSIGGGYTLTGVPLGFSRIRTVVFGSLVSTARFVAVGQTTATAATRTGVNLGLVQTVFIGGLGDDTFRLRPSGDGQFAEVFTDAVSVVPTFRVPAFSGAGLRFEGSSGNDTLVVDVSAGPVPVGVTGIDFWPATATSYDRVRMISGTGNDTMTLVNGTEVSVGDTTVSVSPGFVEIELESLGGIDTILAASGNFRLAAVPAVAPDISVTGGALTFAGLANRARSLSIATGAVARLVAGGTSPFVTGSLDIGAGGVLFTRDRDVLVDYTGSSPISTLIGYVLGGQVIADDEFGGLPTQLAISEAADLGLSDFAGVPVDESAVPMKFTYVGDANLDGQVDALDYERVDLAIGNTGVLGTAQGDLNYDGAVDALDYEQVDLNIGNGVGGPLGRVVGAPVATLVNLFSKKKVEEEAVWGV